MGRKKGKTYRCDESVISHFFEIRITPPKKTPECSSEILYDYDYNYDFYEEDYDSFSNFSNYKTFKNSKKKIVRRKKKNKKYKRDKQVYKVKGIVNTRMQKKEEKRENRIEENREAQKDNIKMGIKEYRKVNYNTYYREEITNQTNPYNPDDFVLNNEDRDLEIALQRSKQQTHMPAFALFGEEEVDEDLRRVLELSKTETTPEERRKRLLEELQYREITPEDYELLLELDEAIKPKTINNEQLEKKTTEIEVDSELIGQKCNICMEEYIEKDKVRILQCEHLFHSRCIEEYLKNFAHKCPMCRTEI